MTREAALSGIQSFGLQVIRAPRVLVFALVALCGVVVLALPFVVTSRYYMGLLIVAGVYAVLVLGFNFALGYTGQISLGHAAFFAIGAYTSALLSVNLKFPFWMALPSAALAAGLVGAAVGLPCLRLRGHYLALATLGLGEIVRLTLMNWKDLTRGAEGIINIPPPAFGPIVIDSKAGSFYLVAACVALLAFVALRLERSRFGRSFLSIREHETAAESVGVNTTARKVLAFALSAAYAGIAGSLYAHTVGVITPDVFSFQESVIIATMLVVGGMGSVAGAILGAVTITFLPEMLRFLQDWYMMAYATGVILCMLFMPFGLAGLGRTLWRRFTHGAVDSTGEFALESPSTPRERVREFLGTFNVTHAVSGAMDARVPALELRALTKHYGGLCAVDALDMKIYPKEIHALIGPNGAGKTTVVNMVSGVSVPTGGAILIRGANLYGKKPHVFAATHVARTFQSPALFRDLSVLDNVLIAQDWYARTDLADAVFHTRRGRDEEKRMRERAAAVLRVVGLEKKRDMEARNLPYGQQRLLEIARALAMQPQLLLVDEPAAGMNEREVLYLQELLGAIRDSGITILIVEHNMPMVMRLADRVTVLNFGRKICEGTPETVKCNPAVLEAYLGSGEEKTLC